jgi:hypothetical protein
MIWLSHLLTLIVPDEGSLIVPDDGYLIVPDEGYLIVSDEGYQQQVVIRSCKSRKIRQYKGVIRYDQ